MDRPMREPEVIVPKEARRSRRRARITRRRAILGGVGGVVAAAAGGCEWLHRQAEKQARKGSGGQGAAEPEGTTDVFKNEAPKGTLWEQWKKRGWAREARHYKKLKGKILCQLCPNACLLQPEDRGRCRNRVHKEGKLWALGYGCPCSFNPDPIEKKPLYHFLPATGSFSIAVPGCCLRCLNCQNWEISQRKPDDADIKDPSGEEVRPTPERIRDFSARQLYQFLSWHRKSLSLFPEDVVRLAKRFGCASIAYTYSEPSVWYEYMFDTAKLARAEKIRNVWVTCGNMNPKPLKELCWYMDAANVDLKSFSDKVYRKLNSGKLQPILQTLKILKDHGVWFEVTNLVVPTYTDDLDMIRRMCDWLVKNVGPDYPLHFSRFHPAHKLTHLSPTPQQVLVEARDIARKAGLHYVYVGNIRTVADSGTTRCPQCGKVVVDREIYFVRRVDIQNGKCKHCGTRIAGVWS